MADVAGWLNEKLRDDPRLRAVPIPVIEEIVMTALAHMSELPFDAEVTLESLLFNATHEICTKCDSIVLARFAHTPEPGSPTDQVPPTMCVKCWNKHCDANHTPDEKCCEHCGYSLPGAQMPCDTEGCEGNVPKENVS